MPAIITIRLMSKMYVHRNIGVSIRSDWDNLGQEFDSIINISLPHIKKVK